MSYLTIVLNQAQLRLKEDGISTLVSGIDWDPTTYRPFGSSGCWVDPVTYTAMLEPTCWNPNWPQSNAGEYAKWARSDFGLSSPWEDVAYDNGGPFYTYRGSNSSGLNGTGPSLGINQGVVVDSFNFKGAAGVYSEFECGWSDTGDGSVGVSIRKYSNNSVEIWKDGILRTTGSITGSNIGYYSYQPGSPPARMTDHYVTTAFIPCRDRELLIVSSAGGGFAFAFDELGEGVGGQTILDAAMFWFNVPAPVTPILRLAPLSFATDGTISGLPSGWRLVPPSGSPNLKIYRDLTGNGTVSLNPSSGGPNPYGVPNPVQMQISMSGGPSVSPFVYGCRAWYDAQTASTAAADQDVTEYCQSLELDISDKLGGRRITMVLNQPAALTDLLGQDLTTALALPYQISDSAGTMATGTLEPPDYRTSPGVNDDAIDKLSTVSFVARDATKDAEEFIFSDCIPLDSFSLGDAFRAVATAHGATATVSSSADSFIIKEAGVSANANWAMPIDVGDSALDWYNRLHTSFASTWFLDVDGDNNVVLTDPADMPSTPIITLYGTIQDAMDLGGYSLNDAYRYVYRDFHKRLLEPECNDLWVMGMDPRTGRPIALHYRDTDSADPTKTPSERPANWVGKVKKGGYGDPALNTFDLTNQCLELLQQRVTVCRTIVDFSCEYIDGGQKGQLVTLDGAPVSGPVRLKTFSGTFTQTGGDGVLEPDRPCKYVGEDGDPVFPIGVHGTSADTIAEAWVLKKYQQFMFGEMAAVTRRPWLNVQ